MLCGHGDDEDTKCGFTSARMVALAGRGGRGDGGGAVGVMDLTAVLWLWRASVAEVCGGNGEHGFARRASERERAEQESENERA